MRKSIQQFLTINFLIAVSLSTLIGVVGNFNIRHQNIHILLDTELSIGAHVIEAFLYQKLEPDEISIVQQKINNIPSETLTLAINHSALDKIANRLIHSTQFQVWDTKANRLILRSASAPALSLRPEEGFNDTLYQNRQWRTYSYAIPGSEYKVVTMQQHDLRFGYEKEVLYENLRVLIVIFFILTLATGIIIKRGLYALEKTTHQLQKKQPHHLDPISLSEVPEEVHHMISEINRLMYEIQTMLDRERRFASDAAHELKTPLAAMKAHLQLAQQQDGQLQKDTLIRIEDIIDRYDHIIRQLLSLSRTISMTSLNEHPEINITDVVKSIVAQLAPTALERDIQIAFDYPQDEVKFPIDPHVFSVLASNIIDNATKYTHQSDCILVRLTQHNSHICLTVVDHGPGISDADKPQVTQRFKRVYGTEASGSGLGLNIVTEVLKKLSGSLVLEDTVGGGLTSTIKLNYPNSA
jgi:two-component system sensor histidine kinase QseC